MITREIISEVNESDEITYFEYDLNEYSIQEINAIMKNHEIYKSTK